MEKFCECDSEWEIVFSMVSNRQIQVNFTQENEKKPYYEIQPMECSCCGYWYWYNADHENMMHDLQSMNRC